MLGTEVSAGQAAALPLAEHAPPILFFAEIAFRHGSALLSESRLPNGGRWVGRTDTEDDDGISGFIVSRRFEGMPTLDRQETIEDALGKSAPHSRGAASGTHDRRPDTCRVRGRRRRASGFTGSRRRQEGLLKSSLRGACRMPRMFGEPSTIKRGSRRLNRSRSAARLGVRCLSGPKGPKRTR